MLEHLDIATSSSSAAPLGVPAISTAASSLAVFGWLPYITVVSACINPIAMASSTALPTWCFCLIDMHVSGAVHCRTVHCFMWGTLCTYQEPHAIRAACLEKHARSTTFAPRFNLFRTLETLKNVLGHSTQSLCICTKPVNFTSIQQHAVRTRTVRDAPALGGDTGKPAKDLFVRHMRHAACCMHTNAAHPSDDHGSDPRRIIHHIPGTSET